MTNSTSEEQRSACISSVMAIDKIPPFWEQDPELWFYHIETVFKGENITNSLTKFKIIISKIDINVLVHARDIIKCPGDKPYEKLKSRLVSTYLESETKRIQQLLKGKHLCNKKPSQLLKQMSKLAGYGTASGVVKTLWMKSLPQNIQTVLFSTGMEDINKLAEFADKIQEILPSGKMHAINEGAFYSQEHNANQSKPAYLEAKINDLAQQIALMSSVVKYNQSRNCNNMIGRRFQIDDNLDCMCYYHFKFKGKARKCATPCSWVNSNYHGLENYLM